MAVFFGGSRIVFPSPGHNLLLQELHETHPGGSRMKRLARGYMWWPGLDLDLENEVKLCSVCQCLRNNPAPAPVHPWEWTAKPWSRLHLYYAGRFMGKMFLLIADAHSKWMDLHIAHTSTSQITVDKLRQTYSQTRFSVPSS